jgi:hypothetical protein
MEELVPASLELATRLEKLVASQRRLRRKADSLLDVVLDINRPELSREEREWSKEVGDAGEKVPSWGGEVEKVGFERVIWYDFF